MEDKKYTIQELIEELQKIEDKTLEVITEGCDCSGSWNGEITINDDDIIINRK